MIRHLVSHLRDWLFSPFKLAADAVVAVWRNGFELGFIEASLLWLSLILTGLTLWLLFRTAAQ